MSKKEVNSFLMLNYWSEQTAVSSDNELSRAINRMHMDSSTLLVSFFTIISEKAQKEIEKI